MSRTPWARIGAFACAATMTILAVAATPASGATAQWQPTRADDILAGANALAATLPAPTATPAALTLGRSARGGVAPNDVIVCTIESTVGFALGSSPYPLATSKAATTCPVPMTNLVAQVFLYEFRSGMWTTASIGNYAYGPGFQRTSETFAECFGGTRHYQAIGYHEAHKTGYVPARGYSTSGPRILEC